MSLGQAGFRVVQSFTGHPLLDSLMVFSAKYSILLVPACLLYLWFKSEQGKKDSIYSVFSIGLGISATYFLGLFYFHLPPHLQGFETILTNEPENAFPSQHAAAVFSVVWPLIQQDRWRMAYILGFAAFLTGLGRVYTGLHFPVDILGGVLASFIGFLLVFLFRDSVYGFSDSCVDLWNKTVRNH